MFEYFQGLDRFRPLETTYRQFLAFGSQRLLRLALALRNEFDPEQEDCSQATILLEASEQMCYYDGFGTTQKMGCLDLAQNYRI